LVFPALFQQPASVEPPFRHYYLIDLSGEKVASLRTAVGDRKDVQIEQGDCNEILLERVFPEVRYEQYRRALCVLDPYGLHLDWRVIEQAGRMRSIDIFLNFPIMDMNRNALWRHPEKLEKEALARMNAFWGDDSWRRIAYRKVPTLFGEDEEKASNEDVVAGFMNRLRTVAGFGFVPVPLPMYNSKGAAVYYLFLASHKLVAENIVQAIFAKHAARGRGPVGT
jgi:three-Cys-motif partner protein